MLGILTVFGMAYAVRTVYKTYALKGKVRALQLENTRLRKELLSMTSRLDSMYQTQKVIASYLGLPIYFSKLEEIGIGGSLKDTDLEKVKTYVEFQERLLSVLEKKALSDRNRLKHLPSIPPIQAPIVSGFGVRKDPVVGGLEFHKGFDFAAPEGTPVVATADGTVEFAGRKGDGYGKQVVINHGYGIRTRYAHMSKIVVRAGEKVKRGQILGFVGNTGKSVGAHLHYEVLVNGSPTNPSRYLLVKFPNR